MISFILFNACFLIAVYNIYNYLFYRPKNFPPGPPKVPWFGSYIFMLLIDYKHLHKAAQKICEFYKSNIIGMHLGSTPVIILNDNEKVKKALLHRDFDGKPDVLIGRLRDPDFNLRGIFFVDGDKWHEQRRFALRYLRDFGFGRRFEMLEKYIQEEIAQYIELLKYGPKYSYEADYVKDGKVKLPGAFSPLFGNCFLQVLFSERLPRDKMGDLYRVAGASLNFQRKGDDYGKLYSILPVVAKLFPNLSDFKPAREASVQLYEFIKRLVDEHIRTYDEDHERNFIDIYIKRMREEADAGMESDFSYEELVLTCVDFSFPPLSALSITITFLIQQILIQPEIQEKIQREIDSVVGQGRFPTLDDRINLPYTEAAIREIMRFETLVPSGLMHKALKDTQFLGYDIPAGTFVVTTLDAASNDIDVWNCPDKFQPERFLDASGKLSLIQDQSMPFGAGKRLCAGETFARNMLFLFTTALFQSFSVSLPPGAKIHRFENNHTGLVRSPPDHWIQLQVR